MKYSFMKTKIFNEIFFFIINLFIDYLKRDFKLILIFFLFKTKQINKKLNLKLK